jgi:hypothetical protein
MDVALLAAALLLSFFSLPRLRGRVREGASYLLSRSWGIKRPLPTGLRSVDLPRKRER